MHGHQVGKGAGMNWETGTDIQTRPRIKQTAKENLSHGQGPYSVLGGDLNGEETQKEWICVYGQLIHFAAQKKVTQQCKDTVKCFKKRKEAATIPGPEGHREEAVLQGQGRGSRGQGQDGTTAGLHQASWSCGELKLCGTWPRRVWREETCLEVSVLPPHPFPPLSG